MPIAANLGPKTLPVFACRDLLRESLRLGPYKAGFARGDTVMAYRGDDLDLRTPQTWASPADMPGELSVPQNGKRGTYRAGPILVDDAVLLCCNNAYDVAVAHRAAEVRLEHLLNAMTRVEAAAAALEDRGVRVGHLRRESAVAAEEIPSVAGDGAISPRRSEDLADLLRFAANAAARRNAPASIDDLLQVLLDNRSEFPASELLARHVTRHLLRDAGEPLPPLTRGSADHRYPAIAGTRSASDYPRTYRADLAGTPTDAIQNSRIEALEQMVRALSQDFSNERHILAGMVRNLGREGGAHDAGRERRQPMLLDRAPDDEQRGGHLNETLVAKLESIETALDLRLEEMSQSWAVLSQRLQDLEASVRERGEAESGTTLDDIRQAIDLKPLTHRLDVIEEALLGDGSAGRGELGERFDKLHADVSRAIATTSDGGRTETLIAGLDRMSAFAEKLDEQHRASIVAAAELGERIAAVERAVMGEIETAAAKHQAYTGDLSEVHDALMKLNQNQHTLAGSMDQWRSDAATDVGNILSCVASLDRDLSLPVETLNLLEARLDSLNHLILEHDRRRRGFWYWLFGTDDWMRDSWNLRKPAREPEERQDAGPGAA
jgi:hypothetical protein